MNKRGIIITAVVLLGLAVTVSALQMQQNTRSKAADDGQSFSFGAAGDFGTGSNYQAVVNAAGASNLSMFVGLGDFAYQANQEQSWCNTFKAKMPNLALIAGNHDNGESTGGQVSNYLTHCPFPLKYTGDYLKQYYVDYPQTGTPLARFILITPNLKGSLNNVYTVGSPGYTFTQNAIDDARAKGIKWIVVGFHKNFFTTPEADLMNMLYNKRVDLILQGHAHWYTRSKQLTCAASGYNAACVADADNNLVKGAGTVVQVIGVGGNSLNAVSVNPQSSYFAIGDSSTYGFGKFTVSATQLQYNFVRAAAGNFSDSFTITDNSTSLPTPTRTPTPAAPTPTGMPSQGFSFGAAGDFANGSNFQATANVAGTAGLQFLLGLGDFSYTAGTEQAWCNTFKSKINNVLLLAGNHDTGESSGGDINQFRTFCPFTLGNMTGDYGKQYYFDYPSTNPLARFIMIAPGLKGSVNISYAAGGAGYVFTQNAIDDARARGIKWIVVGMHKNYISVMEKGNELGTDLMPMLFNKKVDLILQGHEHGYERSKQLTCATTGSYNASCVVDADNNLVKGAGSVIHVLGTGGQSLRGINTGDAEFPYFAKTDTTTYGLGKFTVSPSVLSYTFVRSAGGTMTDSFTISDSGTAPTVTPTRVPTPTRILTPTSTPVPAPGSTLVTLDLKLHGIGRGGDNANPQSTGTMAPLRPQRNVTLEIFNAQSQPVLTKQGTVTFNATSGTFRGTVNLGTGFQSGNYLVKVKSDQYLKTLVPGIHTITAGTQNTVPQTALIASDINNDNVVNIVDYTMLMGCYSDLTPAKNCPAGDERKADLTDDGNVNQFDYNLFSREVSNQRGE